MMVIWHKGTGTYMAFDEVVAVDVPDHIVDADDIEEWLRDNT